MSDLTKAGIVSHPYANHYRAWDQDTTKSRFSFTSTSYAGSVHDSTSDRSYRHTRASRPQVRHNQHPENTFASYTASQPVPLSTPPPKLHPQIDISAIKSVKKAEKPRLIRPCSRIWRDRKKIKRIDYNDLRPISRFDPIYKGLEPVEEVNEAIIDLLAFLEKYQETTPYPSPLHSASPHDMPHTSIYQIPSAVPSSQLLAPSPVPDVPEDATAIDPLDEALGTDSDFMELLTPPAETSDPFIATRKDTFPTTTQCRRPPPLKLTRPINPRLPFNHRIHPYANPLNLPCSPTRRSQKIDKLALLSPLPIASPGVMHARKVSDGKNDRLPDETGPKRGGTSARGIDENNRHLYSCNPALDLEYAMGELLSSTGETSADILWFDDPETEYTRSTSNSGLEMSGNEIYPSHGTISFPLPPNRINGYDSPRPPRPPREDDMGMGVFESFPFGSTTLSGEIIPGLLPPIQFSSDLAPSTPLYNTNQSLTPSPLPLKKERGWKPELRGDHSFLNALSRGEDPVRPKSPFSIRSGFSSPSSLLSCLSTSSAESESSVTSAISGPSSTSSGERKRLPKRGTLPDSWKMERLI